MLNLVDTGVIKYLSIPRLGKCVDLNESVICPYDDNLDVSNAF